MARADQEIAEAEMLELEAAAAADQHLVDQAETRQMTWTWRSCWTTWG